MGTATRSSGSARRTRTWWHWSGYEFAAGITPRTLQLSGMVIDRAFSKKHPHSIVWKDVSWGFYRAMLREFDERPSRINYDRGTLEIMTLCLEQESYKTV